MKRSVVSALGVAVFCVICNAYASAADPAVVEFKQNYHEGDRFDVLFSQNLEITYRGIYNGRVYNTIKRVEAGQDKGLLTILETHDGVPSAERIDLDPASGEFTQHTGHAPRQINTRLAGKSVIVRRDPDGGRIACEVDGLDDPSVARILHNWLDRDTMIYPPHPVRLKEKWDLSQKLARAMRLAEDQQVFAFCKLVAVENRNGRQYAKLLLSSGFVGTDLRYPSVHLEAQLEGPAWVELATGRIAKMDLTGEMHASGTIPVQVNGRMYEVNAEGTGKAEWHQICFAARSHKPMLTADGK